MERSRGRHDQLETGADEEVLGLRDEDGHGIGGDHVGGGTGPVLDDGRVDGVVVGTDAEGRLAGGVVDDPEPAQVPPVVGGVGAVHVEREGVHPAGEGERRVVADHRAVRPAQHGGRIGVGDERPGADPHVETGDGTGLLPEAVERDTVRRDRPRFLDPQLLVARLVVGRRGATHR